MDKCKSLFLFIFGYLGTDSMSVYTIICSLIGRSDSLGREEVQVYVLFLPYMYLLMNLYLAPDKLPLTPHPYSICHNNKESKKGGGKNASCIYFFSFVYLCSTIYKTESSSSGYNTLSLSNPSASRDKSIYEILHLMHFLALSSASVSQ